MPGKQKFYWIFCIGSGILFQWLFFDKQPGLNHLIYGLLNIALIVYAHPFSSYSRTFFYLLALYFTVSLCVVRVHTDISVAVFWLFTILVSGTAGYHQIKHLQFVPHTLLHAPAVLLQPFTEQKTGPKGFRWVQVLMFSIVPLITISILIGLYAASNTLFANSLQWLFNALDRFFGHISIGRVVTAMVGLGICMVLFKNRISAFTAKRDAGLPTDLIRTRTKNPFILGLSRVLLTKNKVAIATFLVLNLLIGWLNYLDLTHIWTHFSWDGGFLKNMVHEGTHLLIFALLISIGITLFYLRGNLLFLNNRWFFLLVVLWLIQNLFMTGSVWVRNTLYIEHFALAYKRIFVYFFLAGCASGLLSLLYKMYRKKSVYFVVQWNLIAALALMVFTTCFNWDRIIAQYNFKHYQSAYVHLRFLSGLNNSALPILDKTEPELETIHAAQTSRFPFVKEKEYLQIDYLNKINNRKQQFVHSWKNQSVLEWNYADYKAFQELEKRKP